MKKTFVFLLTLIISLKSFACSCECKGDCSFIKISKGSEFVALIKVIEYSDFLDEDISDSARTTEESILRKIQNK